jgi:type II secretory pathway component PulJ
MRIFTNKKRLGFTLVEMMMSLSCGTFILAAVIAASVSLQKSFTAMQSYSTIEGDQLRVLDYISMDCRRATAASVNNGALTLTMPVYYNSSSSPAYQAYTPTLSNGAVVYGSGSVQITYAQSGTNFTREVKVLNSGGGTVSDQTTPIARNVSTFTVNPIIQSNPWATVSCNIMFFPTFLRNTGSGTWWSGSSAPGNGTGSNGDWYVIDSTATDQSTVGNVYFKSGGAFSMVQNVKATTVYCNTFLRNASAR